MVTNQRPQILQKRVCVVQWSDSPHLIVDEGIIPIPRPKPVSVNFCDRLVDWMKSGIDNFNGPDTNSSGEQRVQATPDFHQVGKGFRDIYGNNLHFGVYASVRARGRDKPWIADAKNRLKRLAKMVLDRGPIRLGLPTVKSRTFVSDVEAKTRQRRFRSLHCFKSESHTRGTATEGHVLLVQVCNLLLENSQIHEAESKAARHGPDGSLIQRIQ